MMDKEQLQPADAGRLDQPVRRLVCWWLGCRPDWHAMHYDAEAIPCERCGAADTTYADRCGDTRHNRAKDWLSWWLWRRWLPRKCPACGGRFGCRADCDGIPF